MITRLAHANVVCSDIERSLRFYCDILGGKGSLNAQWS
jgi:catechol 2,3-dioxygenase-like lactoylglutathione lyase family enzyme